MKIQPVELKDGRWELVKTAVEAARKESAADLAAVQQPTLKPAEMAAVLGRALQRLAALEEALRRG